MVNKTIILDFDGVLTNLNSGFKLNPEKLELMSKIIEATDCSLVISSAWRNHDVESIGGAESYRTNSIK